MATGWIAASFVSQQTGMTGKLRNDCLRRLDQQLTNTVHSFMVRKDCNRLPGQRSNAKSTAQARAAQALYILYLCLHSAK